MERAVAVVTDSTASLPAALAEAADLVVVPLQVAIDGVPYREGIDLSPARLVEALRSGARVTTSQPGPEAFSRVYARVAARGAREVVSVHLSGELSSTVTSARTAAQSAGVPVHVVDSGTVGMGLGFAALAAAREPAGGAAAARAAEVRASRSRVLFAVDTLEHLRRGGRLGPVATALGSVLGLRPVLGVRQGRLELVEKVRTSVRARERVVDLMLAEVADRARCQVAVHHLGAEDLAQDVAERFRAAGADVTAVHCVEISAVVGAHAGPGLLAVVVADA